MPNPRPVPLFELATGPGALAAAWRQVRRKKGGPGGDGMTLDGFAAGLEGRLARLSGSLRDGRYRPGPLRRYPIAKPDGGLRWLAIPTVTDRVAQGAFANALSAHLDPAMADGSFAYRPGRSVELAVGRVVTYRLWGFGHVIDADIERFFDRVPHTEMTACLDDAIDCRRTVRLVADWLGGFTSWHRGLAQGSPISPILANLYLTPIDRAFAGRRVRLVRYADDLLLFCRTRRSAEVALNRLARELRSLHLSLNPEKTTVTGFAAGFTFLGHRFQGDRVVRIAGTAGGGRPSEGGPAESGCPGSAGSSHLQ